MRRMQVALATLLTAVALLLPATPVGARAFFSFGFGFPLVYPYPAYPYYDPPPAYYYPPPPPPPYVPYAYAPPPPAPPGLRCYAGAYTCPLERQGRVGDACACATPRGLAWGRVGG